MRGAKGIRAARGQGKLEMTFIVVATLYFSVSEHAAARCVVSTVRLPWKLPPMAVTLSFKSSLQKNTSSQKTRERKRKINGWEKKRARGCPQVFCETKKTNQCQQLKCASKRGCESFLFLHPNEGAGSETAP